MGFEKKKTEKGETFRNKAFVFFRTCAHTSGFFYLLGGEASRPTSRRKTVWGTWKGGMAPRIGTERAFPPRGCDGGDFIPLHLGTAHSGGAGRAPTVTSRDVFLSTEKDETFRC